MAEEKQNESVIIFVAGAHNVGKSTVIKELLRSNDLEVSLVKSVSMSDILNKLAIERGYASIVELNQNDYARQSLQYEVVSGLKHSDFKVTLLDGHYLNIAYDGTIFGTNYNSGTGPVICFDAVVVVTAKPETIKERRIKRDRGSWTTDVDKINVEQEMEISEAKKMGSNCNSPVYIIENSDLNVAVESLKAIVRKFI